MDLLRDLGLYIATQFYLPIIQGFSFQRNCIFFFFFRKSRGDEHLAKRYVLSHTSAGEKVSILSLRNFMSQFGFRFEVKTEGSCCTQGVLALKFSISILMQTQGQHRRQMFCKIVQNYVSISDFASRQLNLRKLHKSHKFSRFFLFFKKCKF